MHGTAIARLSADFPQRSNCESGNAKSAQPALDDMRCANSSSLERDCLRQMLHNYCAIPTPVNARAPSDADRIRCAPRWN